MSLHGGMTLATDHLGRGSYSLVTHFKVDVPWKKICVLRVYIIIFLAVIRVVCEKLLCEER